MPAPPAPLHRVFVYGTLRAGESNHHRIAHATREADARTLPAYTLIDLGPYPGMLTGGAAAVAGEVYLVDEATRDDLDALEGHPDLYQRLPITLADGREAEVYLLPESWRARCPAIPGGDWCARQAPAR